jgi:molybdopterin-guanine dinucleotide biosynthesis protein A
MTPRVFASDTSSFDAVVLAGGTSRRMGGGDKTALTLGGVSLLERALDAVAGAGRIVVVGDERPTAQPVEWTREEPPGGGPAAALACGLRLVTASLVVVLAGDLPFVRRETVDRLLAAARPAGAVMVDDAGHPQWLLSCWPTELFRVALAGEQYGRSLRGQLGSLTPERLKGVGARPEWFDCDDPADLTAAKELLDEPARRLAR